MSAGESKKVCPACSRSGATWCSDSRPSKLMRLTVTRRRYGCTCGHRWTTIEVPAEMVDDFRATASLTAKLRVILSEAGAAGAALSRHLSDMEERQSEDDRRPWRSAA